jgi:hypothetical protein
MDEAPVITVHPKSQSTRDGDFSTFVVVAEGSAPLTYQWFYDGAPIPHATGTMHSARVNKSNQGGKITVRVSNEFGSVESAPVTINVE